MQRTESELRARSSLHLNWAHTIGNERLYCANPPRAKTGDSRHGRGPQPSRPSPPVLQEELSRPATLRVGLWVLVAPCPDTGPRCEVGVPDPGPGSWARVPRVHRDEYRRTQSNSVPSTGPFNRCDLQFAVREPHVGNEPTLRPDCGGPFRDGAGSDGTPPDGGPSPLVFLLLLPSGTIGLMANLQGHGQSRCITSP